MADRPRQLPEGVPPLNSYYVYLTGGCNLACRHCWLSPTFQPDGGTGGHLDYDLFALAIEEGIPLGLQSVKLTGGEPLLHPHLVRMVDLLREKNLRLTIETNGTLLTASLARYLKDQSTLNFISVSLDGANPETHETFRGVKGSFEKACQGIRFLVEVGYRPQVIMGLHAGNENEIESLVRMAEQLGAGSVKLNMVQPIGRGKLMTQRGQALDVLRLIELGKWVDTLQERSTLRLHYSWPIAFYGLNRLQNLDGYSCSIFNILGILPDGHLAMCGIGVHVPELCYGMLGRDHIPEIWVSNPLLVELRKSLPVSLEGVCRECIFRDQCVGACVAENYHISGKLGAPFWFCQEARSLGIFPENRLTTG